MYTSSLPLKPKQFRSKSLTALSDCPIACSAQAVAVAIELQDTAFNVEELSQPAS